MREKTGVDTTFRNFPYHPHFQKFRRTKLTRSILWRCALVSSICWSPRICDNLIRWWKPLIRLVINMAAGHIFSTGSVGCQLLNTLGARAASPLLNNILGARATRSVTIPWERGLPARCFVTSKILSDRWFHRFFTLKLFICSRARFIVPNPHETGS